MPMNGSNLFILTGGPGAGKSTLIDALAQRGYAVSPEAGRRIIREQMEGSGRALPWADREQFARIMLAREIKSYRARRAEEGPVFFDRGVPDVVGYLRHEGLPVPGRMLLAAELFRYNRKVFICPPWPEIYGQDAERRQNPAVAAATYHAMVRTYTGLGYRLVEVPRVSVERRADFVLAAAVKA